MIPYFEDKGIVIYHGDYRDVLPRLDVDSADLLISDVPYGQRYEGTGFRRAQLPMMEILNDDGSFDLEDFLQVALRVLKSSRHLYLFGPFDLSAHPRLSGVTELIWDKELNGCGDVESLWSTSHEKITFAINGKRYGTEAKLRGNVAGRLRRGSVLHAQKLIGSAASNHLTGKPVPLLRELIEASSHLGETVIDPCMGAGSTLEAAYLEGRRAIGIELAESNCERAAEYFGMGRIQEVLEFSA
jgi:site-specific DNA-methyltransferase (adenine-specific)